MVSGGGPYYAPLAEMDFAEVRADVERHLVLPMRVARLATGKVRPGGSLVFISGTGGRRRGMGLTLIGALTAAAPALTENLAVEIAPIRVNLVAPGFVDTGLSASLLGEGLEARREELRDRLPIRRVVGPEDVAALSVHLMSNTALTGGDVRHRRRPEAGLGDALRHRSRRHVPGLRAARPGPRHAAAQRDPGRRPADPHARARPLLPEGAPAAPRARGLLSEDRRGLHEDRDDLDRRAPHVAGVPRVGRRPVAVPRGPGPDRAAGPGDPGVHRPRQRPDDPAHARAQARARGPPHLQRLLVLGSPDDLRPLARPPRRVGRDPPGLGSGVPGLREAWDAGESSSFHGWDKRGVAGSGGP